MNDVIDFIILMAILIEVFGILFMTARLGSLIEIKDENTTKGFIQEFFKGSWDYIFNNTNLFGKITGAIIYILWIFPAVLLNIICILLCCIFCFLSDLRHK